MRVKFSSVNLYSPFSFNPRCLESNSSENLALKPNRSMEIKKIYNIIEYCKILKIKIKTIMNGIIYGWVIEVIEWKH